MMRRTQVAGIVLVAAVATVTVLFVLPMIQAS